MTVNERLERLIIASQMDLNDCDTHYNADYLDLTDAFDDCTESDVTATAGNMPYSLDFG